MFKRCIEAKKKQNRKTVDGSTTTISRAAGGFHLLLLGETRGLSCPFACTCNIKHKFDLSYTLSRCDFLDGTHIIFIGV